MHYTTLLFPLTTLLTLITATPTPILSSPRQVNTISPTILQTLYEANPTSVSPNTQLFHVSTLIDPQTGHQVNRTYQYVAFQNIPSDANTCTLTYTFPANYPITSSGSPQVSVYAVYRDDPSDIVYPNDLSWSTMPAWEGTFGTVTFASGSTGVINSESCEENLAFVFAIADWVGTDSTVEFTEYINKLNGAGAAGVFLTYD